MKFMFYLLAVISLSSCAKSYYLFNTDSSVDVYTTQTLGKVFWTIPKGEQIIATKIRSKSRKVEYYSGTHFISGYIDGRQFPYENIVSSDVHKSFVSGPSTAIINTSTNNTESSRSSRSSLKPTNSSGAVNVKGYYRKDGTYVRPYTRSAPRKH